MGISVITRNYQLTLPKDVRSMKNFRIGDKVLFVVDDDRIELVKADKKILENAAGLWLDLKETGEIYQKRVRAQWKKRSM
ncbi:AbrB/MazE/SpoVT family DNA-binding domain-containing protein [Candidatus Woesearchaeota archaeon]|nr:AbrB/MazE/SpoVT family DNA-binding domain-containing protein [Candidatus Woesearchaeota archaeon]